MHIAGADTPTKTVPTHSPASSNATKDDAEPPVSQTEVHVVIVPTEIIVKKLKHLSSLPEDELRRLLEAYDTGGVGGLTEEQWVKFCSENRMRIASLGEKMISFDDSGEDAIVTVEHAVAGTRKAKRKDTFAQGVVRFLESFAAGGVAGAVSKTVIAPGDRVKIIFQVDSARPFTLRGAFQLGVNTVREYGVAGLWIGNGATMLRVVPYAAITYASFDYYNRGLSKVLLAKTQDGKREEKGAVYVRFFAGALAGATSTTFTYPLDLMRARFAARSSSGKTRFPSYRAAFRDATAKSGVMSLYGGLFPTLVGIMPYAGCSFACFETLKHYIVQVNHLHSDKDIPAWQRLVAGGFSGLVAQSATYPLDIVRRRMQVTPGRYRGVIDALKVIFKEEGLRRGMYKGLSMNWIKGPIATATSFTVNDLIRKRTRAYHETAAEYSSKTNLVTLPEAIACGGVAAGVAKLSTLPFDRIKILYQLGIAETDRVGRKGFTALSSLVRRSPNMWSSASVAMLRVVPYGALTYCLFDVFQTISQRVMYSHTPTLATNFVAGGTAAALGTFLVYPLDLLRTRMAFAQIPKKQSFVWMLVATSRKLGVSALWEGCYISMMGVGVLAGIGFAAYEYLKERYNCTTFGTRLAAGMASGIVGQALTYPISVVKRNRQAEYMVYSRTPRPLTSMLLNPNFFATLYRKMPFSWTLSSLTFGISFAMNDTCRDWAVAARSDIMHDLVFSPSGAATP